MGDLAGHHGTGRAALRDDRRSPGNWPRAGGDGGGGILLEREWNGSADHDFRAQLRYRCVVWHRADHQPARRNIDWVGSASRKPLHAVANGGAMMPQASTSPLPNRGAKTASLARGDASGSRQLMRCTGALKVAGRLITLT